MEGGAWLLPAVQFLTTRGIPVCGHVGLQPQFVNALGGFRVQGRSATAAEALVADGAALVAAGASMLVLECVPSDLGEALTRAVSVPVIGIGAGLHCSGQVLVIYDALGVTSARLPRFVRNFMKGQDSIEGALAAFVSEWSRSSGVHADFHAQGWHETRFAPEAENALYRVVLEALTNVQRHANARRVGVILERRADEVLVIVEDDGTGFDVEAMSLIGSTRRLGLIGMKERASLVGGMLTIESGASGTTVFIRVPVGPRG